MAYSEQAHTIDDIARALVRPVVTFVFATGFVGFTYLGIVSGEVFAATAGMVMAFWFGTRDKDKADERMVQATVAARQRPEGPDVVMNIDRPSHVTATER